MKFRNNIRFVVALLTMLGLAGQAVARENVKSATPRSGLKTTATGCAPATAEIDLDINNVRAHLMTGGDMWWNRGTENASYEVPKGSNRHSQFAASCWIGGFDKQGQLKVAAQTYRQDGNDYWPGALNPSGKITDDTCRLWDKFWKIDRSTIKRFVQNYKSGGDVSATEFDVIRQWPAKGNKDVIGNSSAADLATAPRLRLYSGNTYAPFVDVDNDGNYNPEMGDYPEITGDQYIWWVFNDAGNVKQQSLTAAMGIEVQTSAFAYSTQDFLNNSTFYNYRVINRGSLTIDSTYIAVWDDADLGAYLDDFIGCDTSRGLGILYNGTNSDGQSAGYPANSYGNNPPQVGLDFFQGPKRIKHTPTGDTIEQLKMTNFTYFNNDASTIGNPTNGIQIYNYMTGSIRNGERFSNDFNGPGLQSRGYGSGPISNFVFTGDPGDNSQWSECACNNNPGDRRFIFSSGPFQLLPGAVNDIVFGCIWAPNAGGCGGAVSFKAIKNIDDGAQALFDSHFKTVEGPEAPRLVVRELDKKLVFYLINDYGSNNYGENYGNMSGAYKDSAQYHQMVVKAKSAGSADSLYRFEGYRIFQLASSQVSAADIFDPNTGEVDPSKAVEVKKFDVRNGVTQIVNYTKRLSISDTTFAPQVKVNGLDSGIMHSFVITEDKFAKGNDKSLINYHNYYFVAIAYAYNNFARFDPRNVTTTQDVPYIASAHGGGGTEIKVVAALPNPTNGNMGNTLGSEYGQGVMVTRVQGVGNGGNAVQLTQRSEDEILTNNRADTLTYEMGAGPIGVQVIDPVVVKPLDWVLQINGANTSIATNPTGIETNGSWVLTAFDNKMPVDTIYSEVTIGKINEQILEKYGLSVTVGQVAPPGADQANGNGYITSDVTFEQKSQPWLFGVADGADSTFRNWLRSGNNHKFKSVSATNPCFFNDHESRLDTNSAYQNLLDNFSGATSSWGPYALAAYWGNGGHFPGASACGFIPSAFRVNTIANISDVNIVFTDDKNKWTRCAVIELQDDEALSENRASKFTIRRHRSWNAESKGNTPSYSENSLDTGMSWFPGYAINQMTGERLNIVFGEDSYLSGDNGNDMIWNPTATVFNPFDGSIVFGGKHFVYVLGTRYDSCKAFAKGVQSATAANPLPSVTAYAAIQWVGLPVLNPNVKFKNLESGLIPTKTTVRFRVNKAYAPFQGADTTSKFWLDGTSVVSGKVSNPYYKFSTRGMEAHVLSDTSDRSKLLARIFPVPNPYYGYSGYEAPNSRFDTKVRIINLPTRTTINIYTLDGTLVRTLSKSDATPYIDWDIRNSVGLPVASGMYLMHVNAEGIGETVLRWFGAVRPLDVSTY
jgi:hypothetical protein